MPVLTVSSEVVPRRKLMSKMKGGTPGPLREDRRQRRLAKRRRKSAERRARRRAGAVTPSATDIGSGLYRDYQLYALRLEDDNYYIGMTSYRNVMYRFNEHMSGGKRSALWTKAHKPIEVIETRQIGAMYQSEAAKLENIMTIEYIDKYGIAHVRGGDMCFMDRSTAQARYSLLKMALSRA